MRISSSGIGGGTFITLLAALCALACGESQAPPAAKPTPAPTAPHASAPQDAAASQPTAPKASEAHTEAPAELAKRGRQVYLGNCTACHNMDPSQPGPLGPELIGSPPALIEARVMRAAYPPGYQPKRDTTLMIALPYLADDLDALAAYLGQ